MQPTAPIVGQGDRVSSGFEGSLLQPGLTLARGCNLPAVSARNGVLTGFLLAPADPANYATALRLAEEFGYRLVLDHGTESYLIADRVAEAGVPVLYGPLIVSRSKVEVRHRTPAAPGLLAAAGVEVSIITDHPVVPIEFLVHQAALAVKHGMDPADALRALTLHPARVLGLEDRLGSLAPGKDADLVLWEGDPLDVRNRSLRVWQGGREVMHRGADGEAVIAPR